MFRIGKVMTELACPLCHTLYLAEEEEVVRDNSAPYKIRHRSGEEEEQMGWKFYCESCQRWMRLAPVYNFLREVKIYDKGEGYERHL